MNTRLGRISRAVFARIPKEGMRLRSSAHLQATVISTPAESSASFCAVVPGTISKSAVVRNTLRRRLRSLARKRIARIGAHRAMVVYVKKGCEKLSFNDLGKEFDILFATLPVLDV